MALLLLLNNFFHDFSAAGWLFGSILLWSLLKKRSQFENSADFITSIIKTVRCLMNISLAGIIVFGVIRAVAYKSFEWSVEAGNGQITLLAVKHVFFTVIFIIGLVYYIKAGNLLRKATDGN